MLENQDDETLFEVHTSLVRAKKSWRHESQWIAFHKNL